MSQGNTGTEQDFLDSLQATANTDWNSITNIPSDISDGDDVDDADSDPTNEMNISVIMNGSDLEITDGNGTITTDLSSLNNVYYSGPGIEISNNIISLNCGLSIGDYYQGGIIFWLDSSGCHGLVCTSTDINTGIPWWNGSFTTTDAKKNGIGAGIYNADRIYNSQGSGSYASEICFLYQGDNYGDWYFTSRYELRLMYLNIGQGNALGLGNIGGFSNGSYWSSTESGSIDAYRKVFNNGFESNDFKYYSYRVRAVRRF